MNDDLDYPEGDPFASDDPEAAAREARRREREARRGGGAAQEPAAAPVPTPAPAPETAAVAPQPAETPGTVETPVPDPRPARPRSVFGSSSPGSGGSDWPAWGMRLVALVVIAAAVGLVVYAVTQVGGGDDPSATGKPAKAVKTIDLTIPEGLTIDQIKPIAKDAGLKGDYVKAAKKAPKGFPLDKYGAKGAPNLEGFLFPATYELEKGAPVADLVEKQLAAFEDNLASVKLAYSEDKNLTVYDVVKIASMVEREVQVPKERELVSAVIYNRLANGEPLGIDATLRYELGKYDGQLLQSELDAPSPYNTRTTAGLPPTPIGNPGLDSLDAAANPAKSDVYYFVVKPGTCGEHFFTADQAEFDVAAAEYQAALEAEGGSPTECG